MGKWKLKAETVTSLYIERLFQELNDKYDSLFTECLANHFYTPTQRGVNRQKIVMQRNRKKFEIWWNQLIFIVKTIRELDVVYEYNSWLHTTILRVSGRPVTPWKAQSKKRCPRAWSIEIK